MSCVNITSLPTCIQLTHLGSVSFEFPLNEAWMFVCGEFDQFWRRWTILCWRRSSIWNSDPRQPLPHKVQKGKKKSKFQKWNFESIFSGSWQLHKAKRSLRLIFLFPERRFGFFLVFDERRLRSRIVFFLMFVNRRFWERGQEALLLAREEGLLLARGQEALLVRLEEHLARIRVPEKKTFDVRKWNRDPWKMLNWSFMEFLPD